jgi:hypothetical protein
MNKLVMHKLLIKKNIPIHKALGAIFLFVPGDNSSGGYRTLLTYINYLVKK